MKKVRLRNGVVIEGPDEASLNFLFHEIWIDEYYARPGYEINEGETVVDVGANIGVFAFYAATRAPGVKVCSFEPFPPNADYFLKNRSASSLENVDFFPAAVGAGEGERTLHVEDSWILHSLMEKDSIETGVTVQCVSLESVLSDLEACDLLKLDCEGSEYEILYAAPETVLRKVRRIVCEFNILDEDERNGRGLRDFLLRRGFCVDELESLDEGSGFICAHRV